GTRADRVTGSRATARQVRARPSGEDRPARDRVASGRNRGVPSARDGAVASARDHVRSARLRVAIRAPPGTPTFPVAPARSVGHPTGVASSDPGPTIAAEGGPVLADRGRTEPAPNPASARRSRPPLP